MTWNYRVIKTTDGDNPWYEIREVYYDQVGKPMGHCSATAGGETVDEIKECMKMMESALTKAVIKDTDFK